MLYQDISEIYSHYGSTLFKQQKRHLAYVSQKTDKTWPKLN